MADWEKVETGKMRRLGYFTIAGLVLTFVVWGTIARLNGAVIASGALEVASYRQIVQHNEGGQIADLKVKNGDVVEKGQVLMNLDQEFVRPEYDIYDRLYVENLAEKGRLIAERDELELPIFPQALENYSQESENARDIMVSQLALFNFRREAVSRELELLDERDVQIERRIEGVQAQLDAAIKQSDFISEELVSREKLLTRGLVDRAQVTALRRDQAVNDGNVGKLRSDLAGLNDEKTTLKIERIKLTSTPREEAISRLRELESREVEIFQRRTQLARQLDNLDIKAPISGTVYGTTVFSADTVIQAAEPLLFIVPSSSELVVRARIAGQDINDSYVGQTAELKFSAFNQRKAPYIEGKVLNISADAFVDEQTGARYYEIEVQPELTITDKIDADKLTLGQPVELFLHTNSRTFLDYLMKPLTDNFDRAFREE